MRLPFAALLLALQLAVSAQEFPDDYRQFLVPLTATAVRGANGSLWTTEWTMFNGTSRRLFVIAPFPFLFLSPPVTDSDVAAGATKRLVMAEAVPGFDGAFVYLPAVAVDEVAMTLRVRDVSVNAQSYGTSIPIVPIEQFRSRVRLVDVPTDSAYRAMLRIYGGTPEPQTVRVAIYAAGQTAPLEQYEVTLERNDEIGVVQHAPRPAYAQLDPLPEAVRRAAANVRIEVSSTSATPLWAFVSISHNATQQVTTVLPW